MSIVIAIADGDKPEVTLAATALVVLFDGHSRPNREDRVFETFMAMSVHFTAGESLEEMLADLGGPAEELAGYLVENRELSETTRAAFAMLSRNDNATSNMLGWFINHTQENYGK